MWPRSKKVVTLAIGIGTSLFAIKKYGIVGIVEAGEKAPFPQQPHCIGKECPRTRWNDDWDKREGVEALVHTILIVAHGQADTGKASSNRKNATKAQKVASKGENVEIKNLPSDPRRFVKPKNVANLADGTCPDDGGKQSAAGGNAGDDERIEGLSPLGVSQVRSFLKFFQEEFGGTEMHMIIHGTDPPTTATVKMMETKLEKVQNYSNVETTLLDPLTPPLPGEEQDESPHPGDLARLEAVFRKYFHRLPDDDSQDASELDILVCPPKLVGYFICRFLQVPPDQCTSWGIANGSLTELLVYRNGRVGVHRAGDIGYMPPEDVTYE